MTNALPPNDDDDELELEPLDPEIVAADRARGKQQSEAAVGRIDVDELYGEESQYSDLAIGWETWKQFRFTTRHVLIATAILAIALSLRIWVGVCNSLFALAVAALAAGWFWVMRLERRQDAERARRREEFFTNVRGQSDAAGVEAAPRPAFRFAFSLQEVFITMTIAAVAVAGLRLAGPNVMALVLGLIALAGLVVQATGFEAPRLVILGWLLLMVIYFVVGLWAVSREDGQAASLHDRPAPMHGSAA